MFKIFSITILFTFLLSVTPAAKASLITNGSFEQLDFADNTQLKGLVSGTYLQDFRHKNNAWDVFTALPGWVTTVGHGIELQKNVVTSSQHGSHHLELDSHPNGASNAVMTQTLDSLIIGEEYLLEYFYKPRTNGENDNGINVFWYDAMTQFDGALPASFVSNSTKAITPDWSLQSITLTATAESMNVSFGSFGRQNTLGGLVDNVSMNHIAKVPEPSVWLLTLLGLGLLFRRKKSV